MIDALKDHDWERDPYWPESAVPQKWVETIFATMSAYYGSKFANLWRSAKIDTVKRAWGIELSKISVDQIKAGRNNLSSLNNPPTLPEFICFCKQSRIDSMHEHQNLLRDESQRASRETIDSNVPLIKKSIKSYRQPKPTAEWAYKLIIKSESNLNIPFSVKEIAKSAIMSDAGSAVIDQCLDEATKLNYINIRNIIFSEKSPVCDE